MLEDPKSPKSPHKLVLPENLSISSFHLVNLGEMVLKVAELVKLTQIWIWRPLTRPMIHQRVMLEGPESPKSPNRIELN